VSHLRGAVVLVDHATEDLPALHRRVQRNDGRLVMIGWPLLPGLVPDRRMLPQPDVELPPRAHHGNARSTAVTILSAPQGTPLDPRGISVHTPSL
jgi:hypothetical protein